MDGQPETRYHGKVRVQVGETLIEVNIFDDNREKLYLEIQQAVAQFSPDVKPATAAGREIRRAETAHAAQAASRPAATRPLNAPVCQNCGSSGDVELIAWVDKVTGEKRKEWKCQACKKWVNTNPQPARSLPY